MILAFVAFVFSAQALASSLGAEASETAVAPPKFVPPAMRLDTDRDGVSDQRDRCPNTPRRLPPVLEGCALTDVLVSPAALLDEAAVSLEESSTEIRRSPKLRLRTRKPLKRLARGMARLRLAGAQLSKNPCQASRTASSATATARGGVHQIRDVTFAEQRSVVSHARRFYRERRSRGGDSDEFSVRYYGLAIKRDKAMQAMERLATLRQLMRSACRASGGTRTVTARVVSFDPGSPSAALSDGTTLVLGTVGNMPGIARGSLIVATGVRLGRKALVARSVEAAPGPSATTRHLAPLEGQPLHCTFTPVIAPVQNFAQAPNKIFYDDQRGYFGGGKYLLEVGMGIGAKRGAFCNQKDQYVVNVFIDYEDTYGSDVESLIGTNFGFPESEPPINVPLPNSINFGKPANLRFEVYGFDCELVGDVVQCDQGQLESTMSKPLVLRRQGKWANAVYNRAVFSVGDGSKTDFDVAKIVGYKAQNVMPAGTVVYGWGYEVNNGKSSYPHADWITEGEPFAVHDDVPDPLFPTGLLWAYLNGHRNGNSFHYVAARPTLVTDVVSFCPDNRASFYRLPWQPPSVEEVTQGNNGALTHKGSQKYAFDFIMPLFTPGYAPRGGMVDFVQENLTENSDPNNDDPWVPGNVLLVKHQGGSTWSWYEHMLTNGVVPKAGDIIERGDWVVIVGNTGNSTEPHLHYHVTKTADRGGTTPARFEAIMAWDGGHGDVLSCVTPWERSWMSTNAKPKS